MKQQVKKAIFAVVNFQTDKKMKFSHT